MVLFPQVGKQVVPDQPPEAILSRGSRQISSLVVCALALCTIALDARVSQEGIGEANQMQVCNCRPRGAILVVTEPQQLLQVFGSCVATVQAGVIGAYDRLAHDCVPRRSRFPAGAGAAPPPRRPTLPPLPKHGATLVPCAERRSSLPVSGLRWRRDAAAGDGLRKDAATTGPTGTAAAWCGHR
jgi:hypothetical protein